MRFILVFGPSAVGKMTVGKALAARTGYKLLHNHVSLELANRFFDFGTEPFRKIDRLVRFGIFETVAASDLPGFIFTFSWALNEPKDHAYVAEITNIFRSNGADVYLVELQADQATRLSRNRHPDRLQEKPSKRNIERSEAVLLSDETTYRFHTLPNELGDLPLLTIDNTNLTPESVVQRVIDHFGWKEF